MYSENVWPQSQLYQKWRRIKFSKKSKTLLREATTIDKSCQIYNKTKVYVSQKHGSLTFALYIYIYTVSIVVLVRKKVVRITGNNNGKNTKIVGQNANLNES